MISDMDVAFIVLMFVPDRLLVGHPLLREPTVGHSSIPVGSFLAGSFHYHALERSDNA